MNARKRIAILLIVFVAGCAIYLMYSIAHKIRLKKKSESEVSNLEGLHIFDFDSLHQENVFLHNNKRTLMVLFNSECDHCHNQLIEIERNTHQLKSVNILLISSEPINTIKEFMMHYDFSKEVNIFPCKMNQEDVLSSFGYISYPHLLIYDRDKTLLRKFNGVTRIGEILNYL